MDYGMILQTLLLSMRLGHSAALMLRLGSIDDYGDNFIYVKPSLGVVAGIWNHNINSRPGETICQRHPKEHRPLYSLSLGTKNISELVPIVATGIEKLPFMPSSSVGIPR